MNIEKIKCSCGDEIMRVYIRDKNSFSRLKEAYYCYACNKFKKLKAEFEDLELEE